MTLLMVVLFVAWWPPSLHSWLQLLGSLPNCYVYRSCLLKLFCSQTLPTEGCQLPLHAQRGKTSGDNISEGSESWAPASNGERLCHPRRWWKFSQSKESNSHSCSVLLGFSQSLFYPIQTWTASRHWVNNQQPHLSNVEFSCKAGIVSILHPEPTDNFKLFYSVQ